MSRYTDAHTTPLIDPLLTPRLSQKPPSACADIPLPVVNWQAIDQTAPTRLDGDINANAVPNADLILVTWTSAEWSALDHVMLNSSTPRASDDIAWRQKWFSYFSDDSVNTYSEDSTNDPLFHFQLVGISNTLGEQQRVLLVKSQVHLAHPPWIAGLESMLDTLFARTGAKRIVSTGTAGGGAITDMLGAAIVTNMAQINLEKPENDTCGYNHQTFRCETWFPSEDLYQSTQQSLMFAMDQVWNAATIADAIEELNQGQHDDAGETPEASNASTSNDTYHYADLINAPLSPDNLTQAHIKVAKDQPLLTTDFYYIEETERSSPYCFLEMDDAVIAHQAENAGLEYAFIRNVSDPIVTTHTASGAPIPESVRGNWSGIVYSRCGFYSSFNSVLMSWAAIAGSH
ncbi:hypothetical protein [Enterovibrio norvegicus]|uniref:hypothetical protein n=1 Tax=Enterovibrio norvegicus TaxID=188144 RepID=UPI000C82B79C|nr:hypothetical protein [Enterovibrio norvegicus]PML78412.1 hypothetical protein BCT69_16400 [Enterovibrio norvegicus]